MVMWTKDDGVNKCYISTFDRTQVKAPIVSEDKSMTTGHTTGLTESVGGGNDRRKDFMISFHESMLPDRVSNLVHLTPQSDALLTALGGPANRVERVA